MFDVLMYLFETYIHTEAELRVDQDKLEQDRVRPGRPEMGNPDGVVQYSGLRKCVPANGRITL